MQHVAVETNLCFGKVFINQSDSKGPQIATSGWGFRSNGHCITITGTKMI